MSDEDERDEAVRRAVLYVLQLSDKAVTAFMPVALIRALEQDGWTLTRMRSSLPCLCPKHPGCPKRRRKWRRHCSTCANTCGPFGASPR